VLLRHYYGGERDGNVCFTTIFLRAKPNANHAKKGQSNPELWLNAAKKSHKLNSKTKKN